jgi:hypothetical protein
VRNTHSGIYYARARVNGKLLWKTLGTDSLTVAKARLPKALFELGRGSAKSVAERSGSAGHLFLPRSALVAGTPLLRHKGQNSDMKKKESHQSNERS